MEIDKHSSNLLRGLKEYWFLIVFIAALIIGWTNIQNKQVNADSRIGDVESRLNEKLDNFAEATNNRFQLVEGAQKDNEELTRKVSDALIEIKAQFMYISDRLGK